MQLCVTISEAHRPSAPFLLQGDSPWNLLPQAAQAGYGGVELQLGDPDALDQDDFLGRCGVLSPIF